MSQSIDSINDCVLVGMIKVLEILKDARNDGDNLNNIDFDYIIEHRIRDMVNPRLLHEINICRKGEDFT